MTDEQQSHSRQPRLGKGMVYLGVAMLAMSFILGFAGVSSAGFHDFLQFGGIGFLLAGYLVWKLLKR